MSDVAHSLPLGQSDEEESAAAQPATGRSAGGGPVRWTIVAEAPGLLPAQVIAGRLTAEGIPTRAWQESAGQAFGLTVGLLGTGYVSVPEAYVDQAEALLAEDLTEDEENE